MATKCTVWVEHESGGTRCRYCGLTRAEHPDPLGDMFRAAEAEGGPLPRTIGDALYEMGRRDAAAHAAKAEPAEPPRCICGDNVGWIVDCPEHGPTDGSKRKPAEPPRLPPKLDGEVWRREDPRWVGSVAIVNERVRAFCSYWQHGKLGEKWGEWEAADHEEAQRIFTRWALAERARAEKAEAIAKAERDLRVADIARTDHMWDSGCVPPDVTKRYVAARDALRALGVEP